MTTVTDELEIISTAVARIRASLESVPGLPSPRGITAYSQNDSRWAKQVYSGNTTFSRAGCLVVSVAMIISQHEEILPPEVARRLREARAFEGNLLSHPARIVDAFPFLEWGGVIHWREQPAPLSQLAEYLKRGPVIIEVVWNPLSAVTLQLGNQHFVVATQIASDLSDVHIIDPWDGLEKSLVESAYARPKSWSAARAIHGVRLLWVR